MGIDRADEALLTAVGDGDQRALSELYRRHATGVLRLLARLTSDRHTAEEILQDTFVAIWQHCDSYQRRSSVRSWIFGVARRRAHDTLRGRAPDMVLGEQEVEHVVERTPGPEERTLAGADVCAVAEALAALPQEWRVVLELVAGEGFGYAEVAEALDVPVGTVKSRVHLARRRLADVLAGDNAREARP